MFSYIPFSAASYLISFKTYSLSSGNHKLGISPEFNKLLISSRNDSFVIWLSFIKKADLIYLTPQGIILFFKLSLKSLCLKSFLTSRVPNAHSDINAANLVSVYFPLPPTPTNKAFPRGCLKILHILAICYRHSGKRTKSNLFALSKLYSS